MECKGSNMVLSGNLDFVGCHISVCKMSAFNEMGGGRVFGC